MTIDEIIRHRHRLHSGRQVIRAGHWRVEWEPCDSFVGPEYSLWHHGTRMLHWIDTSDGALVVQISLGHGSVSDQGGMNRAFRQLGLPLYYSRKGGAGLIGPDHSDYRGTARR